MTIGAGGEALRHHIRAEIGVGRRHARQQRFQRRAVLHQRQFGMCAHEIGDLVALHHRAGDVAGAHVAGELARNDARAARFPYPNCRRSGDAGP